MATIHDLPTETLCHVLSNLSAADAVKLVVERNGPLSGFDDWRYLMRLKYPGIRWPPRVSATDAVLVDTLLTSEPPSQDDFMSLLCREMTDVTIGVVERLHMDWGKTLVDAAICGNLEMVDASLCRRDQVPASCVEDAIQTASLRGRLSIVQRLMAECPAPVDVDTAFVFAASHGHVDLVNYLTSRCDIDGEFANAAIIRASENGFLPIVECLVSIGAGNPGANENAAIIEASCNGHLAVVKYLSTLDSVDPGDQESESIKRASIRGHLGVVRYLASLDSVNPGGQDNAPIIRACEHGRLDVVKYLASLDTVTPSAQGNLAFLAAFYLGRVEIATYLASLDSVDPTVQQSESMVLSIINGL